MRTHCLEGSQAEAVVMEVDMAAGEEEEEDAETTADGNDTFRLVATREVLRGGTTVPAHEVAPIEFFIF